MQGRFLDCGAYVNGKNGWGQYRDFLDSFLIVHRRSGTRLLPDNDN
jgi:hypothetical protein